jgi:hypothetical protein
VSFGTVAVMEIIPANGQFPTVETCQNPQDLESVQCTVWRYRFFPSTGNNQLNILVPTSLPLLTPPGFAPGSFGNCSQLYTSAQGDPTTGFGAGIVTHSVCRIAPTAGSVPPGVPNIVIATRPALPGAMAVQLKSGNQKFPRQILGPLSPGIPQITTTTDTVTTLDGTALTVQTNQTGQIVSVTGPGAVLVPGGGAVLCSTTDGAAIAAFPGAPFPGSPWTCDQIVFNDGKNVQAGENSTCYYRTATGSYVRYTC